MTKSQLRAALFAVLALLAPAAAVAQEGDPAVLSQMQRINQRLRSMGLGIAVEQIDFFRSGRAARATASIPRSSAGWPVTGVA